MPKLKRTHKEYGGGSGQTLFDSDLFSVTLWSKSKGIHTTLTPKAAPHIVINFEGIHEELSSDEACIEQLTPPEILKLLKFERTISVNEGKELKAEEIRKCLYID